ncbi:MAG: adenylate/guanylate cyclase domain-containing protein [Actinomycetota bacterium]
MPVCASCGQPNPDVARFCMTCGAALAPAEAAEGARKVVTVLFCDVVGFTPLSERLDPESIHDLMVRFFDEMRVVLERHGGTVEKYIGDAVLAVFGIPLLHEDDAIRAVRAAIEMRERLASLDVELERRWGATLQIRIGVNTGEVAVGDPAEGRSLVVGDAVNLAARLEQTAAPGEVLIGADTYALVRDVVRADPGEALSLKGKREPVVAYRVLDAPPSTAPPRPEPPVVDRVEELATLRRTFETAVAERRPQVALLLGTAGLGKSRLAREFVRTVEAEAAVLTGRCLPYGEGITFWPVAEIVREAAGIEEGDGRAGGRRRIDEVVAGADDADLIAERVAAVMGFAPPSGGMQETFWAIRRFLEILAERRPTVVVIDDVQWAEATLLDLVEYLTGWTRDVPLVLLCLARPDLLDVRPAWGGVSQQLRSVTLTPLSAADSERLVGNLLGASLEEAALSRITDAGGGNPLFVEEMLRMLEDDGLLREHDGAWRVTADLSGVRVPASIQALLSARLDRLTPDERTVIRAAAIVGKDFWWGAVAELVPERVRPRVGGHLQRLVRKQLIRPERSSLPGEDAFSFHHLLIQEAAYGSTPKEVRADLHERFANWMERRAVDGYVENEEVLGYHLERAVRYRQELGGGSGDATPLALRAGAHLESAGRRAFGRGDDTAAADLLRRAADVLSVDEARRLPVLPVHAAALAAAGELAAAGRALADAVDGAAREGDRGVEAHAKVIRLLMLESTDPKERSEVALAELEEIIRVFEEIGDDLGLARAWRLVGDVHLVRARYASADEALRRAIEYARRSGAVWEEFEALGQYVACGVYGPAPIAEVVTRCDEIAEAAGSSPAVEARRLRGLAHVAAMRGRFDEARTLAQRARTRLEDVGLRLRAAFASESLGFLEHLAGDHAAAERELRAGLEVGRELGEQAFTATVAALLAHELAEQGRLGDAASFIDESADAGAEDDLTTQVIWREAQALVLAQRGRNDEASAIAAEAVELAARTDDVNMRADALVVLADVGRSNDRGLGALTEALELYRAKGNEVSAAAVEARLAG